MKATHLLTMGILEKYLLDKPPGDSPPHVTAYMVVDAFFFVLSIAFTAALGYTSGAGQLGPGGLAVLLIALLVCSFVLVCRRLARHNQARRPTNRAPYPSDDGESAPPRPAARRPDTLRRNEPVQLCMPQPVVPTDMPRHSQHSGAFVWATPRDPRPTPAGPAAATSPSR